MIKKMMLLPIVLIIGLANVGACNLHDANAHDIAHECTDSTHTSCVWQGSGKVNKKFTPPRPTLRSTGDQSGSTFDVYMGGFTSDEVIDAFNYAVSIWEKSISSSQHISVYATWSRDLPYNALAGCAPMGYKKDFYGQVERNTIYPYSLYKKLSYTDEILSLDILIDINADREDWYYGTDGNTPDDCYDFVTVILHELAHGLGMQGTCTGGSAFEYSGTYTFSIFDRFLVDGNNQKLDNNSLYPNASTAMSEALVSPLFFSGTQAVKANNNENVALYAPSEFETGSSIYHLDETFDTDDQNALLTYQLDLGRAIHAPGPVLLGMLSDLGWDVIDIAHEVKDFDDASATSKDISFNVFSQYTQDLSDIKLKYKKEGESTYNDAAIVSVGGDEYTATLENLEYNNTYLYYIEATDHNGDETRVCKYPADASVKPSSFLFGADTLAPALSEVLEDVNIWQPYQSSFEMEAVATDNADISAVWVKLYVNGVASDSTALTLSTDPDEFYEGTYKGTVTLPDNVSSVDVVTYEVVAYDASSNSTVYPENDPIEIEISEFTVMNETFVCDFESENDIPFVFDGMEVLSPSKDIAGKSLNTPHPYEVSNEYIATLCYEIPVTSHTNLVYDEIVLVEMAVSGIVYPSSYFYDYVSVEVSVDNGSTWSDLIDGYDSANNPNWTNLWNSHIESGENVYPNSHAFATDEYYNSRTINLVNDGGLNDGDNAILRFRLASDNIIYGWGWCIDNVEINLDGPSSIDDTKEATKIEMYPNPVVDVLHFSKTGDYTVEVFNMYGSKVWSTNLNNQQSLDLSDLAAGVYVVNMSSKDGSIVKTIIKQ